MYTIAMQWKVCWSTLKLYILHLYCVTVCMSPLQVVAEAGKAHVSTQTPHPTEPEAPVERGEELLTVAGGGGGRSFSPLGARGSPSQASSGGGAEGVVSEPTENRIPLVDNSPLLVQDTSTKKVTSLTNEGVCVT